MWLLYPLPFLPRTLRATVVNTDAGLADGFGCDCSWACPAGTVISDGVNLVQGGYIVGRSSAIYTRPMSPLDWGCAGPPAILNVHCEVDSTQQVRESNENNNGWDGELRLFGP